MKNYIKKIFAATTCIMLTTCIVSCESDIDSLGSQFFTGAEGIDAKYPLIAYNINNHDTIRTDAAKLDSVVLGAFTEGQFGMQKSEYITQVRLSGYNPDYGTNAVLDSAVLVLKPTYYADSVTTNTIEDYLYNDETNKDTPAKKVVTTYRIKKYGKTKIAGTDTKFSIKVHEVTDFLGSASDTIVSNKAVAVGQQIGAKEFGGFVTSVVITRDSDNSELFKRDANIRIKMDSTFFNDKIIKKAGKTELSDAATFIRYFRGIKISVAENDGYLFKFLPNTTELNLYYKNDKVDGTTTTRSPIQVTSLNLGAGNTHFLQIAYNRENSQLQNALATSSELNGDPKLFLQGMGGPGAGFHIPAITIDSLKTKFKDDKIGIISAKIRIYNDSDSWDNKYQKPDYFIVRQAKSYTFLQDMTTLASTGLYFLVKPNNLSSGNAYYDFGITQTLKNIVEKNEENKDIVINVGRYTYDQRGTLMGLYSKNFSQNYNSRAYTPNRAVFLGTITDKTNPLYDKGAQLLVTYGKK